MPIIPTVLETTSRGERGWDIYSRLLRERIVFLGTPIDDEVANTIIAQFLFLDAVEPGKEIMLYINSPGGSVTAGLAIYDTMHALQSPVATVCLGQAASMGAILLATGAPGKRVALPNARIMIHQPHMQGASGQATDLNILAQEILRLKQTTTEILARHTGQSVEKLLADMERDRYMSAPESVAYGLVDRVLPPTAERLAASA